ncbi:MAG: hypothetical protein RSC28_03565 [Bacteroidales bacterium]
MNKMIELDALECALIYGGRSEFLAKLFEAIACGVGSFAKICYRANSLRQQTLCRQFEMGDQTLWK